MSEETFIVDSLTESIEILRGEVTTLRSSNKILRKVNSALRQALVSLRNQVAIAQQNDDMFKRLCEGEFDVVGTGGEEGGLPDTQPTAEPTV